MRIRRLLRIAVCLMVVALSGGPSFAQEKKNVRMVFVSLAWNSEIPFRAALARGFFKTQGLQVEPILIRGGPAAIAALVSGEVDFAAIGGAQAVFRSRARGLDLSIIGCTSATTNYILLGNKQTRTVEDLKGKIIGVTGAGTFSEFAMKAFLKKYNINPDKDVILRAIGGTVLRAAAIEKDIIAAAPFSTEDAVRLMKSGYSLISNMSESLGIPQNIIVTRNEFLEKFPETSKRMLKAYIQGIQLAKFNKKEAIKAGYDSGLQGDPEIVSAAWDLYAPGLTSDLSIVTSGLQQMLDEDIRAGLIDSKFTLDRVINDRILKLAQQELRAEGRLKP
ncbi:MAG: ABC transporter substrate-binding protein [Deltaproteobacteria bacterium]|nr:ABC transporter substrate-binding protein [Deltaproteobacteria bacterium]MBI2181279.1 ABC transporter substrate-binding protein [Deltaproteobacteria bacterium]MBI2231646.1 ABC transporter substrate-binding protein [Deltaproteobacteria bacterium]MBI2531673.1 ABC transporter substrate-binding protein [Deltaproteobacteria bacterium]